jgi:type I restriction enzyme S subunit
LAVRIWNRGPAKLNQHLFRVVEKEGVYKGIIPLILDHAIEELEEKSHGTTMKHITKQTLLPHKVLLPPLPEQKRIVDLISSVDSYIEALRQELASAESIRSSISESLWSSFSLRSKLSSFGETLTGSTPPTKKLQYWESHEVDFFTPSDLGASPKLNTASRGVSNHGAAISRPLKGFSVLQVCIGATIGKVGYLNHPAVMNQQINALTNLTEHDAPILAAILSSETFQSIIRNTAGGSTLPIISKSSWGEIQIPDVPEGERIKVSLAILESDSFLELSKQLLLSAEKMRSSILHNLLTGTHEIPASYDKVIGAA